MADDHSSSIHLEAPQDRNISVKDRNRLSRLVSVLLISIAVIGIPIIIGSAIGGAIFGSAGSMIFGLAGFITGGFALAAISHRLYVFNEEWTAYVTQDPFSGVNVPYGPALHFTHLWEQRNKEGQYDLKLVTKTFSIKVPTTTTEVTVTGQFQYAINIRRITSYIGTGKEAVEEGLMSFLERSLTHALAADTGENARANTKKTNEDLQREFMGPHSSEDFENKYGIIIVNLVLKTIAVPVDVQKTRDAVGEAKTLMEIVAELSGMDPKVYKQKREDGNITDERHKQLLDRAMAVSDNKTTVSINVIEGGSGVTPMLPIGR